MAYSGWGQEGICRQWGRGLCFKRRRETPAPGVQREHNLLAVDNLGPSGPDGPAGGQLADRLRGQGGRALRGLGRRGLSLRSLGPGRGGAFSSVSLFNSRPSPPRLVASVPPGVGRKLMAETTVATLRLFATTRLHASLFPSPFCHLLPTPPPHPADTQSSNAPWDPFVFSQGGNQNRHSGFLAARAGSGDEDAPLQGPRAWPLGVARI